MEEVLGLWHHGKMRIGMNMLEYRTQLMTRMNCVCRRMVHGKGFVTHRFCHVGAVHEDSLFVFGTNHFLHSMKWRVSFLILHV
jgi:hypothetical protein